MAPTGPAPVRAGDRYESLDVVRGAALFGILLMNIAALGLPNAYADPTVYGGATGVNLWSWIIIVVGFEGTQRGLFSLLFGAGIILLTSRLEKSRADAADIFFRRNVLLMVFGIVLAYPLLWHGEILFAYGFTALVAYIFRKLPPTRLFAIGVAGFVIAAAWNFGETRTSLDMHAASAEAEAAKASGQTLSKPQSEAIEAWHEHIADVKPDAATVQRTLTAFRGSYADVFGAVVPLSQLNHGWWTYRFFFDVFSMMLVGMGLFKTGVLTLERRASTYAAMLAAGYGIGIAVNTLETRWIIDHGFSVLSFEQANVSYDVGRVAMTIGHLGLLLLFCKSGILGRLRRSLAAVGTLALTNYVSHAIICAFVFYGFGFGLYGHLERHQLYYVVFSIWLFQLVASPIYLRYFQYGPLEWIWRWATYGERPPLRNGGGGKAIAAA